VGADNLIRQTSIMRKLGIDPKVVADHMGHDVNVNLNVYTQTFKKSSRILDKFASPALASRAEDMSPYLSRIVQEFELFEIIGGTRLGSP
jgi:hypothetical protein